MNRKELDELDNKGKLFEMCSCGHLGGTRGAAIYTNDNINPHSAGYMGVSAGHGGCRVEGCDCIQFTWIGWCDENGVKLE